MKAVAIRSICAQILFVFATFALMAFFSYLFMSNMMRKNLRQNAENTFSLVQSHITTELQETKSALNNISETVRYMLVHGSDYSTIVDYLTRVTKYHTDPSLESFYGVFNTFGNAFYDGANRTVPEDYEATERPWYKAALEAKGNTALVQLYPNITTNELLITHARQILDNDGEPLAVIAMDININGIRKIVTNQHFKRDGYVVLLDENKNVFVHPSRNAIGKSIYEINEHLAVLTDSVKTTENVSEREIKNYRGERSVLFLWTLENGWHLGFITPKNKYYKNLVDIMLLLSTLGFAMATALSVVIVRYATARDKAIAKAYEASKAKSKFLAAMSHEIRTPMNTIFGLAEINMQDESIPKNVRDEFEKIYNSGGLLLRLINDILDLSKIEAGKLEIRSGQYSVASLVNDAVQLNITRTGSKPIEFKLNLDENIPSELIGDELRIKQILNNLLSNAFKYTEKGRITLSLAVEPGEDDSNVMLVICVRDTGQGMTPEQIKKLFNEYARFNLEANRQIQGAGLGLNITRQLVQMMKGDIDVKSEPGKGSVFTLRIPQKIASLNVLGKELVNKLLNHKFSEITKTKKAQIVRDAMPYGKVLVVDDVEMNLYVAKVLMKPYELNVETAGSGFEAIEKIKAGNEYDIVFMDHMMPKMDGMETTKLIREAGYKRPVVALTANAVAGQAEIFLSNGFDDFISKPIDIRQLNAILNKFIRDKQR